ncbi:MAG: amino acid permease [Vulcanimicrobiota bacterium]
MDNSEKKNKPTSEETIDVLEGLRPGDKAIRRIRKPRVSLKRALGVPGIFSIAYGNLGSSVYFALGITAAYALGATPVVFLIAALFFVFTAFTYAEGTAAIPEAGGASSFARKGFNELVSFIAGWCLILSYIALIAISASYAISYLSQLEFFRMLREPGYGLLARGLLLLLLMLINIVGVRKSSILNTILAGIDVTTQIFLVLVGAVFFLNAPKLLSHIHWGVAPTWAQFAMALYLVMISFTGVETLSNLAEEAHEPEVTIPKSMWWSVGIIIFVFMGLSSVGLSAMPAQYQVSGYIYGEKTEELKPGLNADESRFFYYGNVDEGAFKGIPLEKANVNIGNMRTQTDEQGYFVLTAPEYGENTLVVHKTGYGTKKIDFNTKKPDIAPVNGRWTTNLAEKWHDKPLSGIVDNFPLLKLKRVLSVWVSVLAFTILVIATNSGILGVSRLVFSMGTYRQVPPVLARVHPVFRTPFVAIVVFTIIAFLIILPGNIENVAHVYAFAAMFSYTISHVAIIAMRIKHPDMKRPYKIPWNLRVGGTEIPITAVLGALSCFILWVVILFTREYGRNVGLPFIGIGIVIYIIYRKSQNLSLTETVDPKKRR